MKSKRAENIEKFLKVAREKMALQQKSISTERQYLHYAKRFLWFTFELPRDLSSEKKVEAFLSRMALQDDCSASSQNVAFNALVWFYEFVIGKKLAGIESLRATRPVQVREALPMEDVLRLLADVRDTGGYPTSLIVRMLYSCGMRLSDACNLRVKDIVFARKEIRIRGGKGKKDRVIGLPDDLVVPLQRQLVVAHQKFEQDRSNRIPLHLDGGLGKKYPELLWNWHWYWVFPQHFACKHPRTGETVRYRLHQNNVQRAIRESRRRLNLSPQLTPHVLRHSFATHILDMGGNIRALQEQMGHVDVRTTMGYTHADAKSVPDPIAKMREITARQTSINVLPFQSFQNRSMLPLPETKRINFQPA